MIWATISSRSWFCWLCRACPSLATKNIINLILVFDYLVMSMYRVISCVVGRGCFLWRMDSLSKTLLAFALFILYSKAKLACYSRYLLTSYFCILVPYNEKDIFFFLVLLLEGLVGHHRTIWLQLPRHYILLGHTLGLLWYWIVCLGNEQRSFCHFWDCTQVLHFRLFCLLWGLLHFF